MARGPWRLVTVDIDGTLTLVHGWRFLGERFGRVDQYERAMERLRARESGEDETIASLLAIAEGHTVAEVRAGLAGTPKLAAIPEGVRRLHDEGIRAALLTHNPPYVTDWYCDLAGFDRAAGFAGEQPTEPVIGAPVGARADKLGGLAQLLGHYELDPRTVVHVGDAGPDATVFRRVGGGIAVNPVSKAVEEAADLTLWTRDFREVVSGLLELPVRSER
jgi:phosphoserine phosphatase